MTAPTHRADNSEPVPASGGVAEIPPAEPTQPSRLPAPLRAMRPKQWLKNVLVLSAPLAAGRLFEPIVLLQAATAFVAFCLLSATVYLINDIRDIDEDRQHPKKRLRPIAAGELRIPTAWVMAVVCAAAAFIIAFLTSNLLGITLAVYLGLQLLYSLLLKHQPIIDLAMVASGFLLRAVAGGVATGIELSQWFLLVASFGSLFMVAGKRYSEMIALGAEAGTRRSLERYTVSYLRFAWMISAATVLMAYSLWAFENRDLGPLGVPWTALSIAPFTLGLLQYAREIDLGGAGAPEDIVLSDRVLQVIGLLWLVLIAIAVFW